MPEGFELQIRALAYLINCQAKGQPVFMISISTQENSASFRERLRTIDPRLEDFEGEEPIPYPVAKERPSKHRFEHFSGDKSDGVPAEQL